MGVKADHDPHYVGRNAKLNQGISKVPCLFVVQSKMGFARAIGNRLNFRHGGKANLILYELPTGMMMILCLRG